jgi:hypothetical protein
MQLGRAERKRINREDAKVTKEDAKGKSKMNLFVACFATFAFPRLQFHSTR